MIIINNNSTPIVYEDLEVSNENVTNVKAEMERKIEEKNMTISDLEDKIKRGTVVHVVVK